MRQMILHAATDTIGSECTVALDHTKEEWDQLSEDEQLQIINEYSSNIVDLWITEEEENEEL